jgi:zinc/manganese transport system substrate-binding protein
MIVRVSLLAAGLLLGFPLATQAAPTIVAAENMYGDVAAQIAGPDATATSILSNPDQDPHLFEASPSVARALSSAALVLYNGA